MNGQGVNGEEQWSDDEDGQARQNKDEPKNEKVILTYRTRQSKEDSDDELDLVKMAEGYSNVPVNMRSYSSNDEQVMVSEFNTPESRRADFKQKQKGLSIVEFKKKVLKARMKDEEKTGQDYLNEVTQYLVEKYNTAMVDRADFSSVESGNHLR